MRRKILREREMWALFFLLAACDAARVKKIIAIMLENHSFDNYLGNLNKTSTGVKPTSCNTQSSSGTRYCATNRGAWSDPDPDHSVHGTSWQIYGTESPSSPQDPNARAMSGFVDSYSKAVNVSQGGAIMDCFDPSHVPIISTLAQSFTLIDTYHASVPGPTFPNRLFFFSATSHGFGDNDDVETVIGWPQKSIFGALNSTQWRVYFSDVPSALLMADARMGLLEGNFRSIKEFDRDAAAGDLPDFTFVEPAFLDIPGAPASDQHPAHDVRDGERLVKGVYEALRASPLWNESTLLISWDEHGGFYDSVPPPVANIPPPDNLPCSDCKYPASFNVRAFFFFFARAQSPSFRALPPFPPFSLTPSPHPTGPTPTPTPSSVHAPGRAGAHGGGVPLGHQQRGAPPPRWVLL